MREYINQFLYQKTPLSRNRTRCILSRWNAAPRSHLNTKSKALRLVKKRQPLVGSWLLHLNTVCCGRDPTAQEKTRFGKIGLGQVLGRKIWTLRTRPSSAKRNRLLVNRQLWGLLWDRRWGWHANRDVFHWFISNHK